MLSISDTVGRVAKALTEGPKQMVGSRVSCKWRAPEGDAHGTKKWFEGTVESVT